MTEKAISPADMDLIFTTELKSSGKGNQEDRSDRLDYDEYLSCLILIAQKCYPSSLSPEDAMQQLLMDNILPLASRRKPIDINSFLLNAGIGQLYTYYKDSLNELFRFFATHSEQDKKVRSMVKSTSGSTKAKSFDEEKDLISEAKRRLTSQGPGQKMGYHEFMRFSSEFGIVSMGLTSLDLGDIYLSVLSMQNFEPMVRSIDFNEFWEALIRCALLAFKNISVSAEDKVKGMFLYIWRHLQTAVRDQMPIGADGGGFNTYKGEWRWD